MSKRILIVRLSAVGDTILSMPIACALRRSVHEAELGWVVAKGAADLLHGHACIDQLFVTPPDVFESPRSLLRFAKTLRHWKPDVVIDAQGLTKSALLGWLSGARRRIGLTKSEFEGRELSTWLNNEIVKPAGPHVVDRGLDLLKPLGIEHPQVEFCVPEFVDERKRVRGFINAMGLGAHWSMINVGAGWVSKVWPEDRYAAVAIHLHRNWKLPSVVVWGGAKERAAAERVVALSQGTAILAPSTTLPELAEWIRCTNLFVGSDTGPMHLAAAVGTPTVGLIGPMPAERVGPRGPTNVAVQVARLPDSQRSQRKTECGPMLSIDVESVCQACDRSLGFSLPKRVVA